MAEEVKSCTICAEVLAKEKWMQKIVADPWQ